MFGFIKRWLLRSELQKIASNKGGSDTLLEFSEQYLKQNFKRHSDALKVADRLNNAKMISMQTKDLKNALREGLDDNDDSDDGEDIDDDDDDDLPIDLQGVLTDVIKNKLMGGSPPQTSGQGLPLQSSAQISPIRAEVEQFIRNVPDDKLEFYHKFLKTKGLL